MADVTQQSYRAAFLWYVEDMQPTELKSRGKESLLGATYKPYEVIIETTTKKSYERTE